MTNQNSNNPIPPHDISMEEVLLGAILIDGAQYDQIQPLAASDYYHEPHQMIYAAMVNLVKSGTAIDQLTVADRLNTMGKLEAAGGVSYLMHIVSVCPTPLDAPDYAAAVKRMSISRQIVVAGQKIAQIGFSNPPDVAQALIECDQCLTDIRKSGIRSPIISPKERADMLFEHYQALKNSDTVAAVPTGIYLLDQALGGGLHNSDLIIAGGRTGMGKTSFAANIARTVSKKCNVLYCSAEMNIFGLSDREVAQDVGVSINRIRLGKYDDQMFDAIMDSVGKIKERNIWMYHQPPMTTEHILQFALGMQLRYGLGLVIIDYLGILDDSYGKSNYERVTYISRQLKLMADILDVPVLALHQLNRDAEGRDDKRPQLSDLRDSGGIEQDADVVILLYRDSYYAEEESDDNYDLTEIILAKQRQGKQNVTIKARYDKKRQLYISGGDGESTGQLFK